MCVFSTVNRGDVNFGGRPRRSMTSRTSASSERAPRVSTVANWNEELRAARAHFKTHQVLTTSRIITSPGWASTLSAI